MKKIAPIPLLEGIKIINEEGGEEGYITDAVKKRVQRDIRNIWDTNQMKRPEDAPNIVKHLDQLYADLKTKETTFRGNYEKLGKDYEKQNEIGIYDQHQHINFLEKQLKKLEKLAGKEFPVKRWKKGDE